MTDQSAASGTGLLHEGDYALVAEIEAEFLEDALVPLDAISDEFLVEFGEDGLHVNGTDPTNILMVDVQVPADLFKTIEGETVEFGVYAPALLDYAERAEGPVQIAFDAGENVLEFRAGRYRYKHAVLDAGSVRDHTEIPELDLTAKIRLSSAEFREAAEYCNWCSDCLRFEYDPDERLFTVTSEGDTGTVVFDLPADEILVEEGGRANSLFSLDFSMDIADGLPESQTVTLRLGEEFPMRITYEIPEQNPHGETATVQLLQAPRIKSE